jgi:hypothetical protein
MLFYITAEDVLGDAAPQRRGPRPLPHIPSTVSALYDMGMRHHLRSSALRWPANGGLEAVPDWKLDRLVIRIALYCRENLRLEPGTRAAVFGRLSWLWPAADFAILGFGATSLGIEHDVADVALVAALRDAEPRLIFTTDGASTARLVELRARGLLPETAIVGVAAGTEASELLPIERLLELGGTLDTAERAQAFRMVCRGALAESQALWHLGDRGIERMTHARAMERITGRLRSRPPGADDLVYLQPPRATLGSRLALAAFVGDGLTQAALGRDGAASDEGARVRPTGMLVAADWLEAACAGRGPRFPAGLDRRAARRRLRECFGDRLRWIETERPVDEATKAAVAAAGAIVVVDPEP